MSDIKDNVDKLDEVKSKGAENSDVKKTLGENYDKRCAGENSPGKNNPETGVPSEKGKVEVDGNHFKSEDAKKSDVKKTLDENFKKRSAKENLPESKNPEIHYRNENLAGKNHPETGVPYEQRKVKVEGKNVEVVVPKFESSYDAQLSRDNYKARDKKQFEECNFQLESDVEDDKEIRKKFTEGELEDIGIGATPNGYLWHHDADEGKMQLVDAETHYKTGHTGGKHIWGGER